MCGIVGFIGVRDDLLLNKMTEIISHRGPDDRGLYSDGNISLGHRRLSIIDLSVHGHQPMISPCGKAVIAYNGEVYNFQKIREELLNIGFKFNSKTDTEVILNAYLAWGENCLVRFNGMFAFAIWDKRDSSLFLARDRIGIKPLFYANVGKRLLFASEIKAILCSNDFKREVDLRALDYFLTFRYNHLNQSIFKNISKLEPAHYMKITHKCNGELSIKLNQYWDIPSQNLVKDKEEYIEEKLSKLLKQSVSGMMISDVPLGVFLSSGVDSSTVVGIMKKELDKTVNSFTVGFDYPGFQDELNPVNYTTNFFKTKHTEFICKPDVISLLPKILMSQDEINADPALIPTYLISEIASKSVKVILCGEGADELFCGYERTLFLKYGWQMGSISPHLSKGFGKMLSFFPSRILDMFFKYSSSLGSEGISRLSSFCGNILNIGSSYIDVAATFTHKEKEKLYHGEFLQQMNNENIADTLNRDFFSAPIKNVEDLVYQLSYFELKTRLVHDLLAKVDSMTMAHSIEGRVPYLDHEIVEYAFKISAALKIKRLKEKYILRKAASRFLPNEILKRKKDHFFVPIHLWLQNELKGVIHKVLSKDNINKLGYFNYDFISYALNNYENGHLFYARQIWNLMFFVIWHKLYIESNCFLSKNNSLSLEDLFQEKF